MKREKLWQSLTKSGYTGDESTFRDAVIDEFEESVAPRGWSGDELCFHPSHAIEYCERVRERVVCKSIPFPLILRTLVNIRKRGGGDINVGRETITN